MRKAVWAGVVGVSFFCALPARSGGLSELELRWVKAISPVLQQARQQLPLDIVLQPQPAPDASPIAMGFDGGRCQLVLSLRGNPQAQATLDRLDPQIAGPALELMAAHEIAHCRRHVAGAWEALPAGHAAAVAPATLAAPMRAAYDEMQAVRREEGYADLAGLAWTWQHHPDDYAKVYDWLVAERSRDLIPDSFHDTLAWLRLARDGKSLATAGALDGPASLWTAGLDAVGHGAAVSQADAAGAHS
jgi:hypothetical protein